MSGIDVTLIGLHILLPLALLAWLALAPLAGRLAFVVQVLATGVSLLALALAGVWMVLPWWVPGLYLALWLIAVLIRGSDLLRAGSLLPQGTGAWVGMTVFAALAAWAGSITLSAVDGRGIPADVRVVDLAPPLGPGQYLVVHGGASAAINGHFLTLNPTTERQRDYRGQSYAVDLIEIGPWGLRATGWRPEQPEAYRIFGRPVLAPCDGPVISVLDGRPDMPVPTTDTSRLEGNHVAIRCGDVGVLLAHLQQGSVSVAEGDRLVTGQPVGLAGNSGQTNEPHLHVHVQALPESGPLLSGEPFHLTIDGLFPIRNDRLTFDE